MAGQVSCIADFLDLKDLSDVGVHPSISHMLSWLREVSSSGTVLTTKDRRILKEHAIKLFYHCFEKKEELSKLSGAQGDSSSPTEHPDTDCLWRVSSFHRSRSVHTVRK